MSTKIEVDGKGMAMFNNAELVKLTEGENGKKAHKARTELNKRSYDFNSLVQAKP